MKPSAIGLPALFGAVGAVGFYFLPPGFPQAVGTWSIAAVFAALACVPRWRADWAARAFGMFSGPILVMTFLSFAISGFGHYSGDRDVELIGRFVLAATIAAILFFVPAIVARQRQHSNATAIFALNLLLGPIFIGWALALVWALTEDNRPSIVVSPPPSAPPDSSAPAADHAASGATGGGLSMIGSGH